MSDKYVPDETGVRLAYVAGTIEYEDMTDEEILDERKELRAEFDRFMAQVRASALRDAQKIFERSGAPSKWEAGMVSCVLGARAAKFEQEALR